MEVKSIRNRKHSVLVRLNDRELVYLHKLVQQSGLPQEKLLRKIITGYQVKAAPPIEYHETIRQLMAIGKNINQIAVTANSLNFVDHLFFVERYNDLLQIILKIQKAIET